MPPPQTGSVSRRYGVARRAANREEEPRPVPGLRIASHGKEATMNAKRTLAGLVGLWALAAGCKNDVSGPQTGASGRIVFQSTQPGGTPDLLVMDPDGNNVQTLLGGPATDQSPAASPDGSRIAFSSDRAGDF